MNRRPSHDPGSDESTREQVDSDGSTTESTRVFRSSLLDPPRSRYLLYCLHLYANPLRLPDIAHQVTVWEHPDDAEISLDARLKTYLSLYHDHLPELERADLVAYEQGSDMVELGPAADRIEPALERRLRTDLDALLRAEG